MAGDRFKKGLLYFMQTPKLLYKNDAKKKGEFREEKSMRTSYASIQKRRIE